VHETREIETALTGETRKCKSKPVEFFQRYVRKMNKEITVVPKVGSATKKALETSYITSLHIAMSGSSHSIGVWDHAHALNVRG
jgi:hypothetical protein